MPSFVYSKLVPKIKEPEFVEHMLKEGKDPKDKLIQECQPHCEFWK